MTIIWMVKVTALKIRRSCIITGKTGKFCDKITLFYGCGGEGVLMAILGKCAHTNVFLVSDTTSLWGAYEI